MAWTRPKWPISALGFRAQAVAVLMDAGFRYFERPDGRLIKLSDLIEHDYAVAPVLSADAEARVKCLGAETA